MDPSGFDNDIFIELVKKRPCIWNTALAGNHDRIKKRKAWEEVSSEMDPDFKEKSDKEKNALVGKLLKKWKNFRDSYLRSVKKKTVSRQAGQNRAYVYSRQLEFLATIATTPCPTVSSIYDESQSVVEEDVDPDNDESQSIVEEDVDDPDNDGEIVPASRPDSVPPPSEAGSSTRPDASPLQILAATVPTSKRAASGFTKLSASKRRAIVEENLLNFMKYPEPTTTVIQPTPVDPDDDKSFFDSLLPLVKPLPMDTKLDFRVRVMEVLRELRAALTSAPAATVGSLQRQMFTQPQMSHFTPLVIPKHHHQQAAPNLQTTQQGTQQQQSHQWESPESSNASYTSPVDTNME